MKSNICPDPAVKCAPSQTCCQLFDGSFGCCPFKDAVCCKDGQHCCPSGAWILQVFWLQFSCLIFSGMQCDVRHGRCLKNPPNYYETIWKLFFYMQPDTSKVLETDLAMVKVKSWTFVLSKFVFCISFSFIKPTLVKSPNICPNPEDQCLEGQTCCKISPDDYGCCPFKKAVCCKDMLHCCPENMVCNLELDVCEKNPKLSLNLYTILKSRGILP